MFRSETWKVALDALGANKVKAFLTMLGVMIGSACIVLVVTVALTGKQYIMDQIQGVGTNIVYAEYAREGPAGASTAADEISLEDMEAVRREIPQIVEVGGTRSMPMTIVVEGVVHPVNLVGITEGFQRIRNLVVARGRFLDGDDMEGRGKVCLLTEELAALAFPHDDPVGRSVRLGELRFTVVGVFRERVSTFGQSEIQRHTVIIPYTVMTYYTPEEYIRILYAQAARPEDVAAATERVRQVLESRHRSGARYQVENLSSLLQAAGNISLALTVILLLVASIALVISGIGIMNIMLVTVTQRTREIGIRKAIGARRREIMAQFLIEALLISGMGAIAGVVVAVSIPALTRPLLPPQLSVPISWVSIVVALVVSSLTGIFFGYLPANRAAKLQPTESLRYE